MELNDKFTKEVKENWLKTLKSGEYTQARQWYEKDGAMCCLAVFDKVTEKKVDWNQIRIDDELFAGKLIEINDEEEGFKGDYSNVIPFIEKLDTVEL